MQMVSIHNSDTQDFIVEMQQFMESPGNIWIGLVQGKSGIYAIYTMEFIVTF